MNRRNFSFGVFATMFGAFFKKAEAKELSMSLANDEIILKNFFRNHRHTHEDGKHHYVFSVQREELSVIFPNYINEEGTYFGGDWLYSESPDELHFFLKAYPFGPFYRDNGYSPLYIRGSVQKYTLSCLQNPLEFAQRKIDEAHDNLVALYEQHRDADTLEIRRH